MLFSWRLSFLSSGGRGCVRLLPRAAARSTRDSGPGAGVRCYALLAFLSAHWGLGAGDLGRGLRSAVSAFRLQPQAPSCKPLGVTQSEDARRIAVGHTPPGQMGARREKTTTSRPD